MSLGIGYQQAWNFLDGISDGIQFIGDNEHEIALRQGRAHFWTAISNYHLLHSALRSIHGLSSLLNTPLSLRYIEWSVTIIPFSISFLSSKNIENGYLRQFLNFVEDCQGKIAFVVIIVANVASIHLGSRMKAVGLLTYLVIGFLDRKQMFSENIHQGITKYSHLAGMAGGALFGSVLLRGMTMLELFFSILNRLSKKTNEEHIELDDLPVYPVEPASAYTETDFLAKKGPFHYRINRSHIDKSILPPIDDSIDIERIITISESINWEDHLKVLQKKLASDERWQEIGRHQQTHLLKDLFLLFLDYVIQGLFALHLNRMCQHVQKLKERMTPIKVQQISEIAFLKSNLREFVDSIKQRRILQGRPQSYELMHKYCKYITSKLETEMPIIQADLIMKLGVEGGFYCGTAKYRVVEEIFQSYISSDNALSLELRVLSSLQNARLARIQNIYSEILRDNSLTRFMFFFLNKNDIHNFDLFIRNLGLAKLYGLPKLTMANDGQAPASFISEFIYSKRELFGKFFWTGGSERNEVFHLNIRSHFWKPWKWMTRETVISHFAAYDVEGIIADLNHVIGSPVIPKTEIYDWWHQWLKRTSFEPATKTKMLNRFAQKGTLKGSRLEMKNKIKSRFLLPILQELGVISPSDPRTL